MGAVKLYSQMTYSYFGLKRGVTYKCSLDDPEYNGKFIYRLHRHYLQYRYENGTWDYEKGRQSYAWRNVWVAKWYDDTKSFYAIYKTPSKRPDSPRRKRLSARSGRKVHGQSKAK